MARETRERSFDDLARGLANGSVSRGRALKLMGAALVGGTLGSLGGVAAADEECKPLNKKCRKDQQCCSRNCANSTCAPLCPAPPACTDTCPCVSGQTCLNGSCCPNDQVCGSTCGCPSGQ